MAITLGLVDSVDDNGVYVTMPGSRGVLRGPYQTLQSVGAGDRVLIVTTDDGEDVIVGQAAAIRPRSTPATSTDNAVPRFDGTGGALQNSGVTIDDNGDVTGVRNLHASGAANYIRVSSTTVGASAYLDGGASGQWSQVMYRTIVAGVPKNRWALWKTDTSESGSDAGSNLKLTRYNDAGSSLGDALTITRSSGKVTIHTVGATAGLEFGSSSARIMSGTGSPEGVVTAPVGSLWLRTDSSTSLYVKQTGTGNTGWVAK